VSTRPPTALAVVVALLAAAAATEAAAVDTVEVTAVDKEVSFTLQTHRSSILTTFSGYGGGGRGKHISPINSQSRLT
jgi:opacity protein-like surface antigen